MRHLITIALVIGCFSCGLAQAEKRPLELLVHGDPLIMPDSCESMVMAKYGFHAKYEGIKARHNTFYRNSKVRQKLLKRHGGDWEVLLANDLLATCGSDRWHNIFFSLLDG